MAQNPIRTAAAAENGLVVDTLLEAVVKRFGYVLNVAESLGDLDFDVGEPPLVVISAANGFTFFYDADDTTTVDDGTTCLVSGNGLRYKATSGARPFQSSALSFETAPPGSPTVGDVHVVDTSATGDFAGHDEEIALYTRRGWVFATPSIGLTLYLEDSETNWQFTVAGWGGYAVELTDASVRPEALLWSLGIAVESTEDTPPGAPSPDTYWLVGDSATGDFTGEGGNVAYYKDGAWAFLDAYEGATVFHKDFGFLLHNVSGAWLGGAGSDLQEFSTAGGATWTKPAKGTMAFVQVWGGGGSGGRNRTGTNGAGGGGGGGAYRERWIPMADLAATVAVAVAAGGAAKTTIDTPGDAGGTSSFGAHVSAFGGGGGTVSGSTPGAAGGGGGGQLAAGANGSGTTGGAGGANLPGEATGGDGGGVPGGTNGGPGAASAWGGGGGGGGGSNNVSSDGGAGGASAYGGGGGGGGGQDTLGAGGLSYHGGNGGAGASGSSTPATAGSQPGGGGGGSRGGNSGKGGDGRVRVTVI